MDFVAYFNRILPKASLSFAKYAFSLSLFQSMINYMVRNEELSERKRAFTEMRDHLLLYEASTLIPLFRALILHSPYPSIAGNLINVLKERFLFSWNLQAQAQKEPSVSTFPEEIKILTSHEIVDILEKPLMCSQEEIMDRFDLHMSALNALYLILLKEKTTNFTGVWERESLGRLKNTLNIFSQSVNNLKAEYQDRVTHKNLEEMQVEAMVKHGFPKLELDQVHRSNVSTLANLEMLDSSLQLLNSIISS